jgi:cobalt/nickel transport system ATP-binding protein
MIKIRDLHFGRDGKPIFQGLDFNLEKGDRVAIIGPNGAGKTTLCHIIMGLITPWRGEIEIFGKPRRTSKDFDEIRGKIGFLFQDADDQLFCPTVMDDVAFGPLNLGKTPEEARSIVRATLRRLEIEGFEDRFTHKLSGGEKRIVSMATVMAMEPEVLLLDEPTAGLDEKTTERLTKILIDCGLTYAVISHDADFVEKTADRVMKLTEGRLAPVDRPR